MKHTLILVLLLIATAQASAEAQLKCLEFAEKAAAHYAEIPLPEFREEFGVIWSCKLKADPSTEEIQFGDSGGLIGVRAQIVNGKCVLADEVYSGQNDDDADLDWQAENCL